MQWSKLRSHLLELIAPGIRERVDFHLTYYRGFGSSGTEFWITIDQQKVLSGGYGRANIAGHVTSRRTGFRQYGDGPEQKKLDDILQRREIHDPRDITSSIRTYFDLDPQIALTSSDPILKALAIIDKRIGKRTLKSIKLADDEHSLVKAFYALRLEILEG
jgi:hypothetical protein